MAFQDNNKFKNFLAESKRFGYQNRNLPIIVDKSVKITQIYNNNNEKNVIQNNLNKTINNNGRKNRSLASAKIINKTKNRSGIINIGKNNKMNILNTESNSITRTESEISFTSVIPNFNNRNKSTIHSERKKKINKKIEGSNITIHNSQSISKKGDKDLDYNYRNLNKINNQELKEINIYFKTKETENKLKQKPKLDPIDRVKINKNYEIKKNTIIKEDNQILNGVNDEIKKEKDIKHDQSEICGNYNNNLKSETMIKLNENNIDEITDNLIKDPDSKPSQNSINDVKNIKKDTENKPENNPIIGNINIKTEKEKENETEINQNCFCYNNNKTGHGINLDQNNIDDNNKKTDTGIMLDKYYFDNDNNKKTDTGIMLDKYYFDNNNNKKTDTGIMLDQNKIGANDEKESETKIILDKAFKVNKSKNDYYYMNTEAKEKNMIRNNTQEEINLLLMNKNNKYKREASSYDRFKNINQNWNNANLNINKNYVPNNYCNNINTNNCYLPNISRNNGNCNNYNLYNNNNYYNSNKNLNYNNFENNNNYYSRNNFYNS